MRVRPKPLNRRIIVGRRMTVKPRAVALAVGLSGFVQREPELALRLLNGEGGSVRARLLDNIRRLVAEVLPEEAPRLEGFVVTLVQVGDALVWPALVAGDEPSGDEVAKVARALLAAARAGALPPDPA